MRSTLRFFALLGLVPLVGSCTSMDDFSFSGKSLYPGTLEENARVEENQSVLLVGFRGTKSVNYVQYCGSSCKNYRFSPRTDDVVALIMPVPRGDLEFNSYTVAERRTGRITLMSGYTREYGYLAVDDDPPINVDQPGIYYHLTLNADDGSFTPGPDEEMLRLAKTKYGHLLLGLQPANFEWPE